MTKTIRTLLFDLDGTLINTNELIITTFQDTFTHFFPHKTFAREEILQFIGPALRDTFAKISPEKAEEMIKYYRMKNLAYHDQLILEYDGIFEGIQALYEENYKLAVVSTKMYDMVQRGLKISGLDKFFQVVIGLDQVEKVKPDPEGIHLALKLLHSCPEEAIMIGDNYHDILAGKNAGTQTAGVAWSIKGEEHLVQFQPDFMIQNINDLLTIARGISVQE